MRNNKKLALKLVFIYSGEFAERVIRNLINDISFCKSCSLLCDQCKYSVYSYVGSVRAAIQLAPLQELPAFIDNPEQYLPEKIPRADLCISSGIHKDLLLDLPSRIHKAGIKGMIVPIEDFIEVPAGLRKQMTSACEDLGLECAFPKPFCSLTPSEETPAISRLVTELRIGRPKLRISLARRHGRENIESTTVDRSAPCGSTWYVARKLIGVDTKEDVLYDAIAKAHHSYPCTATMAVDPELKEPILHIGGFTIREEVLEALRIST